MMQICDPLPVIERYGFDELKEWVEMDVDDDCMDMDDGPQPMREADVSRLLMDECGVDSLEDFRQLDADTQVMYIARLTEQGVSLRQAARLSSLSYRALWNRLHPDEYQAELERHREERRRRRERKKMNHQGV